MKIGLLDVDGHNFPNLPLMKLSAYHKGLDDFVEPWFGPLRHYDRVYKSKVFSFTLDVVEINADEVIRGGTGYDCAVKLPDEIENVYPDYTLYGITDTAYGFLTRGCPRCCPFCLVTRKEGAESRKVADLRQFWDCQPEVKILDANLLRCVDAPELLRQLANSRAVVDFTQGLDAQVLAMDAYLMALLKTIRVKNLRFAWDDPEKNMIPVFRRIKEFFKYSYRQMCVYVLTNFDSTFDEDLYRVNALKDLGFNPYVMVFNKHSAPLQAKQFQRYVNNKVIFRSCEWADYKPAKKAV